MLAPPLQHWEQATHDEAAASGSTRTPADISTALASMVTAAPTMEGITMTGSGRSITSSWEGGAVIGSVRLSEAGGMVARPGEDMGAGAGAGRVV